jgi:arylsulfatase A-like enzyme
LRRLYCALPWVAAVPAAIDTWLVRRELAHRPVEARLFLESWLLWTLFALLASIPALLTAPLVRRLARIAKEDRALGPQLGALFFWTLAPVLAHMRLDDYTSIGQDVSALLAPRPWIEVSGILLGLGVVAVLLARALAHWTVLRTMLVVGSPAVLTGLFLPGRFEPRETVAPLASAAGKPNLLLLVWDTTRAASLSSYGYERDTTPRLAAFAADSLLYEDARSVSCFTLTSHISMLTGVYPSHHGARLTRMTYDPGKTPSIARLLAEQGYRTGGFVGTDVLRAGTGMADGFEVYDDRVDPRVCDTRAWALVHDVQAILAAHVPALAHNGSPHWIQDMQRPAEGVLRDALAWIENGDPRPWFCFVNLYDAHWPYTPNEASRERWVEPYAGSIDGYLFRSDSYVRAPNTRRGSRLDDEDRRHLRELYDAELAELDDDVGAFLDALGFEQGTVGAVITGDHGEAFGEGGRYEHDDILEPQVHVPLVVRLPHAPGAEVSRGLRAAPASGVDVAATLLAMAGVERPAHLRGVDVTALGDETSRAVLIEDRDRLAMEDCRFALVEGRWKLVVSGSGEGAKLALHDLESDPVGTVDVGDEHPEIRERLHRELLDLRASWGGDKERWGKGSRVGSRGLEDLGYTGAGSDEDAQ